MKSLPILFATILVSACYADRQSCAKLDRRLIECPAPRAPRATELKPGKVSLEYKVGADGRVRGVKVVSVSGDRRWAESATAAVSAWRYKPGEAAYAATQKFEFTNE